MIKVRRVVLCLFTIFKLKNLEFLWFDFSIFRIHKDQCINFKFTGKAPKGPTP